MGEPLRRPTGEYRTLYCAEQPLTCLREVLGDLRPSTKARADFERFQLEQGLAAADVHRPAAEVSLAWRREHVLAPAVVERVGPLADLGDRALLEQLADTHAALLADHGMTQLDVSAITSRTRAITQAISRDLYDRGAAGLLFRSNHDLGRCIVVFEGRARLRPAGRAHHLTENHPALLQVCSEYGLVLRAAGTPASPARFWRP